jgi:hypothetical protein
MNRIQKFAIAYVLIMVVGIYGYAIGRFKVFPYDSIEPFVQNYLAFAKGDSMEKKTSVVAKLKNDLGVSPDRWAYSYPALAAENTLPADHPTLDRGRDAPLVFVDDAHRAGYRVIIGALDLQDTFWGALLLDSEGKIIHSWSLTTAHLPAKSATDLLKNLYGVHVFPDGSIIFLMQERGGGIVKVDACSKVLWNLEGEFHHVVSPDEHGYFWSFIGQQKAFDQNMVKISVDTGEIVQLIDMVDVRKANPDLHIWDLYQYKFESRKALKANGDMTHGNDIEPLPQALAADFPDYEPGDLVVSYATSNLVFIVNPETLKVKWWRIGVSDLQHDPDWEEGGFISILSNNSRSIKGYSDIVTINPVTMEHKVTLEGSTVGFKTIVNGQHQLTPFGTRFVTSANQGWAFEVNQEGAIVFSFVNNVESENGKALHLSEALRYQEDYFDTQFWNNCE